MMQTKSRIHWKHVISEEKTITEWHSQIGEDWYKAAVKARRAKNLVKFAHCMKVSADHYGIARERRELGLDDSREIVEPPRKRGAIDWSAGGREKTDNEIARTTDYGMEP